MFKLVQLLARDDGYTHDEFVARWQGDHAEIAEQLPGLRKYAVSLPSSPERAPYDGVAELYFESEADMKTAFGSAVGEELQADAAEFVDMDVSPTLFLNEDVRLVTTD